jgi:hypothetical protein
LVELFDWYNQCDDKTLAIHEDNIHYDLMFMHYLMTNVRYPDQSMLSRYKELKFDNVASYLAQTVSNNISRQVRQPDFDQQAVANKFQELHQLLDIAEMAGDKATAKKLQDIAETQLKTLDGISPEMGNAYRNFYNSLGRSRMIVQQDTNQ